MTIFHSQSETEGVGATFSRTTDIVLEHVTTVRGVVSRSASAQTCEVHVFTMGQEMPVLLNGGDAMAFMDKWNVWRQTNELD